MLRHSLPAQALHRVFFPTAWTAVRLRSFHRPHLKRYGRGPLAKARQLYPVASLVAHMRAIDAERERQRAAQGGVDVFPMRSASHLSGRDSELVLFEYIEQYPPLINQPGMATRLKNYYKRVSTLLCAHTLCAAWRRTTTDA
jgi:transcription initiation factor TFIID subunit 1